MTEGICAICSNSYNNALFTAREMMFGMRTRFVYQQCGSCGCLQLLNVPPDLEQYYPADYYSFSSHAQPHQALAVALVKRMRRKVMLRAPTRIVDSLVRRNVVPAPFQWFAGLHLSSSSSICDVGSGNGQGLAWMHRQGFRNLSGFDPYISSDRYVAPGVAVRRLSVNEMPAGWDLIMVHHAFEHMGDPTHVIGQLAERLTEGGRLLIRTPLADSWARRSYGTNWVQLDAPRHLFVHTQRSMAILASSADLCIERVFFDSYALQFWGSEQYQRDIPLRDTRSYADNPEASMFTAKEIRDFTRFSATLNDEGLGDSAGFILRHVSGGDSP